VNRALRAACLSVATQELKATSASRGPTTKAQRPCGCPRALLPSWGAGGTTSSQGLPGRSSVLGKSNQFCRGWGREGLQQGTSGRKKGERERSCLDRLAPRCWPRLDPGCRPACSSPPLPSCLLRLARLCPRRSPCPASASASSS